MSRLYRVSEDTSEKEKIIGGVLTLAQGLWLASGVIVGGGVYLFLSLFLPSGPALVLAVPPGAVFGCMFAFYKKGELQLANYLLLNRKFKGKAKLLPNDLPRCQS